MLEFVGHGYECKQKSYKIFTSQSSFGFFRTCIKLYTGSLRSMCQKSGGVFLPVLFIE